jgi:DtxR family transcriptional regulator, manganese transport regulator
MPEESLPFIATRKHHHQETAEDYTEMIADMIKETGEARTCMLAKKLGVSHVTAVKTLKRLQRDGYIMTTPYKPIELTEKGREMASFSKWRHQTLMKFLIAVGVPKNIAAIDVEGMEHHVSPQTLEAFQKHLKNLKR